jgi:hypothetical protein
MKPGRYGSREALWQVLSHDRDRHRPTGFGCVFADRVEYLDPLRWDALTANASVFLSRSVLRVRVRPTDGLSVRR